MISDSNVTNTVLSFLTCVSKFLIKMSLEYGASAMEEMSQENHTIPALSDYNNHVTHLYKSMMEKAKVEELKLKEVKIEEILFF